MSMCFDLACTECHEGVWIGQMNLSGHWIYTGEKDTMQLLNEFLWKHESHKLEFCEDQIFWDRWEDYKNFKDNLPTKGDNQE